MHCIVTTEDFYNQLYSCAIQVYEENDDEACKQYYKIIEDQVYDKRPCQDKWMKKIVM